MLVINRKKVIISSVILLALLSLPTLYQKYHNSHRVKMVMGGILYTQNFDEENEKTISKNEDVETYFRPSDLPVLNDRTIYSSHFFQSYFQKNISKPVLPKELMKSPEETILNYFSVLREAANWEEGKNAGCGTLGQSTIPYPVAYQFLSPSYREKLPYEEYLNSFKNILHTSLIKYKKIPVYENPSGIIRYFVEIETIGGSKENIANFSYYYGFVDLVKEEGLYKISNLEFTGENYLCAPYHGWSYDAESSVQIRYGGWCKLIKKLYPVEQDGYVKYIYFTGTDGYDYVIEFFQLTNDTDIEIAQYRKDRNGEWELIKLDPEKCLENQ